MPRRTATRRGDRPPGQAAGGLPRLPRGITGNAALKGHMAIDPTPRSSRPPRWRRQRRRRRDDAELLEEFMPAQPEEVPEPQEPAQPEAPVDDCRHLEPPSASAGKLAAPAVYGDSAYGGGPSLALLEQMGATPMVKVQGPHARNGCFTKDRFVIDLAGAVVTCPTTSRSPCGRSTTGVATPASARPARAARCGPSAPPPRTAGSSASACMKPFCRRPPDPG